MLRKWNLREILAYSCRRSSHTVRVSRFGLRELRALQLLDFAADVVHIGYILLKTRGPRTCA